MRPRNWLRVAAVIAIAVVALALRVRAVELLPIDYDEDDYLRAAQQYADGIARGDWGVLLRENYRPEHPPLNKLAYGLALAPLPTAPEIPDRPTSAPPADSLPEPHLTVARLTGTLFSLLQVLALAAVSPLAGLFLAINTWHIKYTAQVMVESLPSLTSALCVLFYVKSQGRPNPWRTLSAVMLGLTAAGKYLYCIAGIAVMAHWLWSSFPRETRRSGRVLARWLLPVAAWGVVALLVFFAADPYLWPSPVERLKASLLYHGSYATGAAEVEAAALPAWQPLVYLFESVPWHPGVFVVTLDLAVTILALIGWPALWQRQRVIALWLVFGLGFLLVWPTKWPQYVLMLSVPLTLAAAEGLQVQIWQPLRNRWDRLRAEGWRLRAPRLMPWRDTRRALPWLVPGALALGVIALYPLVFQAAMSLTDFNVFAIRDGLNGGVWRAAWEGLTGQAPAVEVQIFGDVSRSKEVGYAGLGVLLQLISGSFAPVLVFDLIWTACGVALQGALGVGVALMLHRRGVRFARAWQALFILPWAIPEFVGALIWLHVFEPTNGWLSLALGRTLDWQQNPTSALAVLLIAATWMGWPLIMLAAGAGLKMIPPDVHDAAAIDGAGGWAKLRNVTLPLLWPLLAPALIIRAIFTFNQFYVFYVMQPPVPQFTLAAVSFFFFNATSGFGGRFAVSAAINVFTVLVLIALLIWFNRWSRASEGVTYTG